MREAGFDQSTPLFVASGLLTYSKGARSGDWREADAILAHRNLASEVHYKEKYIPASELAGKHEPQDASACGFALTAGGGARRAWDTRRWNLGCYTSGPALHSAHA